MRLFFRRHRIESVSLFNFDPLHKVRRGGLYTLGILSLMESHSFGASSNPDPGSGIPFVEEGCGIGTGTVRGH